MKTLLPYLKRYTKETILAPLFKLFEVALELLVPIIVASIVDTGIGEKNKGYIIGMCSLLALLGAMGLALALVAQFFAARAATGFAAGVRRALFEKILSLSPKDTDRLGASALITRLTGDVNQVQTGLNLTLRLLLRSPVVVFGAAIMAFIVDKRSSIPFFVAIPILFVAVFVIMLYGVPLFMKVQAKMENVVNLTRENLSGVRVIRACCREEREYADFEKVNRTHARAKTVSGTVSALLNPITFVIVNIAVIILLSNGSDRVYKGEITQGQVVALYNYMAIILTELIKFADLVINITKSVSSAKRIGLVLNTKSSMEYGNETVEEYDYAFELDGVSLRYSADSEYVLEDISLRAEKGQRLGVIGITGSGKTSLISLIARLYDCTSGSVRVFGKDVKSFKEGELSSHIGLAGQYAELFYGTVRENIALGRGQLTDEDINTALEISQSSEFVNKLSQGTEFLIEEKGRNLSGGQRQRLNIARALAGQPQILILDSSTSALDYLTAKKLEEALSQLPEETTVITVSQRVNAVYSCDRIAVLDGGRIAGVDTHSELYDKCPVYREICLSQGFGREGAL